jgi:hypothetical protein
MEISQPKWWLIIIIIAITVFSKAQGHISSEFLPIPCQA